MKNNKIKNRFGEENINNQGSIMRIVEYIDNKNMIVEFQDEHSARVKCYYANFRKGEVANPYFPSIYNVGMTGTKYPVHYKNDEGDRVITKEYATFKHMLGRCYDKKELKRLPTYKDVYVCKEWHNRDNFEDWIRSQENYNKFLEGDFQLDKDILIKGNNVYSPDTCVLVPRSVNMLFVTKRGGRGDLPIGVRKSGLKYSAKCRNTIEKREVFWGMYDTPEEAFLAYKEYKENIIKQVAQIEFDKGNITKKCYDAMLKYEVEITD